MRAQTRVIPGPTVTLSMAAQELSLDGAFESRSVPVIYDLTGDTDSEPEMAVVSHSLPRCSPVPPPFGDRRACPFSERLGLLRTTNRS